MRYEEYNRNMQYLIILGLHEQAAIQFGKIDMKVDTHFVDHMFVDWRKRPDADDTAGFWVAGSADGIGWVPINYDRK